MSGLLLCLQGLARWRDFEEAGGPSPCFASRNFISPGCFCVLKDVAVPARRDSAAVPTQQTGNRDAEQPRD